ncbi:hypothetical protein F5Y10DRAFT_165989 [Nemania abortiva]|nr:hypothetical protein F5Y10DRAFT_165989 [Nemania abortiva]
MMPTNSAYSGVELNQFLWYKYGNAAKQRAAQAAGGTAPKKLASEIADREMYISALPPAASTPFGSAHGSHGSRSSQGEQRHRSASNFGGLPVPFNLGPPRAGTPLGSRTGLLGRDPPSYHDSGSSRHGSGSRHGANSSHDGAYDNFYDSNGNDNGDDGSSSDDEDMTERGSLSPTIQFMERSSRYQGVYYWPRGASCAALPALHRFSPTGQIKRRLL